MTGSDQPPLEPTPRQLPARSWWVAAKRAVRESLDDGVIDLAAAMTYFAVLALFPALLVLVSLVGLVGDPEETTESLLNVATDVMPESAADLVEEPIRGLAESQAAGALFSVGLLGAIWSASGYIAAFTRAMNAIYEVEEGRPFWKLRPIQILLTLAVLVGAALIGAALLLSGPVAESVGGVVGLSDEVLTVWDYAKWPVIIILVSLGLGVLYWLMPNVEQPRFRWLTPGSFIAIVIAILASLAFGFYVANFGSYDVTYGSLGAIIVFLVWLWIVNLAILYGGEFDSELERARQIAAGLPATEQLKLPPRNPPKPDN